MAANPKLLLVAVAALSIFLAECSCEIIPYSYSAGRDVDRVERRYQNFLDAKSRGASDEELNQICGPISATQSNCTAVGRPSDAATMFCDTMCCMNGNKVGNCGDATFGIKPDWDKLIFHLISGNIPGALANLKPELVAGCSCSDDWADVKCGHDRAFLGIRCPFDNNACWRKCCRKGANGGKCKGVLNFSCKCEETT